MTNDIQSASSGPGSQATPSAVDASSPGGADPSREDDRKGYLLGKLHERKRAHLERQQ